MIFKRGKFYRVAVIIAWSIQVRQFKPAEQGLLLADLIVDFRDRQPLIGIGLSAEQDSAA